MGNEQCRCECDKGENDLVHAGAKPITPNHEEETISDVKPRAPLTEAPTTDGLGKAEEKGAEPTDAPAASPTDAGEAATMETTRVLNFMIKADSPLGIKCAKSPVPAPLGSLVVTVVNFDPNAPELVTADGKTLQKGDVITEINGQKGLSNEALFAQLMDIRKEGGKLELKVVSRPKVFDVELKRVQETTMMGMVVAVHDEVLDRVEVREITQPGAMTAWNEANVMRQVYAGDWVTAVHSENKGSNEMVNEMQAAWREGSVTFSVTTQVAQAVAEEIQQ